MSGPSNVTTTTVTPAGYRIAVDDERGTTIEVAKYDAGALVLSVDTDTEGISVDLSAFTVDALVDVLRRMTNADEATLMPGARNFPRSNRP